jgi:hypothetical protein
MKDNVVWNKGGVYPKRKSILRFHYFPFFNNSTNNCDNDGG